MFGFYGKKRIAATVAVNAKISNQIDIREANSVVIELPTFTQVITTTANVYALVAATSGGTFQRAAAEGVYSGYSGIREFEVPSTLGDKMVCIPWAVNYGFMKIELSNTATAAYTAYVHIVK